MESTEQQQQQIQHQNQSPDHIEELGLVSQTLQKSSSLSSSDPSSDHIEEELGFDSQNPNQNPDDDDDEISMQIISEELQNLVLEQALNEEKEREHLYELDREEENAKFKENEDGWGDGDDYGDYNYADGEYYNGDRHYDDGENENGYDEEGVSKEEGGFDGDNRIRKQFNTHPLRPDAQDCPYYMKTGMCKFGSNCKFNHPYKRKNQAFPSPLKLGTKEKGKQKEEIQERPGQIDCKYYLTSGGCKYGKACKFNHSRGKGSVSPIVEFNFLGLPIRPGEKECPYYMRTGSCKYGSNCRFHHPDPTIVAGANPSSGFKNGGGVPVQATSRPAVSSWSSPRASNDTAPYVPTMYPPSQGIPSPNPEWNGYQAPVYPTSEKRLPTPPAFAMSNPATKTNFYPRPQQPPLAEEYPERPGQPECSYFIKTGDCKYKFNCKFHHPKSRIAKANVSALSDKGLPLRPDQSVCSFYSRYGICKFGPACRFDHPENYGSSTSSIESDFHQPQQSQMDLGWRGQELEIDH